jgi:hypothetical protein
MEDVLQLKLNERAVHLIIRVAYNEHQRLEKLATECDHDQNIDFNKPSRLSIYPVKRQQAATSCDAYHL